jgi:hypothetical protein
LNDANRGERVWVHIYAPAAESVELRRRHFPTCERRRFFVISFYEWYGPDGTCLWCGERFNDDGRAERPFARGWRAQSKADARAHYRRAHPRPAPLPTSTEARP